MNWREDIFYPGWWKALLVGVACGITFHLLCGCSSPAVSGEPKYPEYDKWWTQSVNTNSFEGLGQGDVYVHEFVTTNIVIDAGSLRHEVITNRMEAVLL